MPRPARVLPPALGLALGLLALPGSARAGERDPFFIDLGLNFPGITGLSADGRTVLGGIYGQPVWIWNAATGSVKVDAHAMVFSALTEDGRTAIVQRLSVDTCFRWTRERGLESAPVAPDGTTYGVAPTDTTDGREITAISSDGSYIGGRTLYRTTNQTYAWDLASGTRLLTPLTMPSDGALVTAISTDGRVVYGSQASSFARWTDGVATILPNRWVNAISRGGTTTVGYTGEYGATSRVAFWKGDALRDLGILPGATYSAAVAVSADGQALLAQGQRSSDRSYIWDPANGLRRVADVLDEQGIGAEIRAGSSLDVTRIVVTPAGLTVVAGTYRPASGGNPHGFVAGFRFASGFTSLGSLQSRGFYSSSRALSADGSTVVGVSDSVTGDRAFVWNAARGMIDIGSGAIGATGVSGDGNVVVGATTPGGYRWQASGTGAWLGPQAAAVGVSGDGAVVVGSSVGPDGQRAVYRWTATTTERYPTYLGSRVAPAQAVAASADGSTFVGATLPHSFAGAAVPTRAFVWSASGGQRALPALPGGTAESEATGVSGDGGVVVGWSRGKNGPEAFRWTLAGGIVGLGNLRNANGTLGNASRALAISPDGSVVVGIGVRDGKNRAFLWDAANGMRDLADVLVARGLDEPIRGWTLYSASGVNVDAAGTVMLTGSGVDPLGRTQAFYATLPVPKPAATASPGTPRP